MTHMRSKTRWATPRSGSTAHKIRHGAAELRNGKIFYSAWWFCDSAGSPDVILLPEEHGIRTCPGCLDGADGPTLYRCYNTAGDLLYIGSTIARRRRMAQHAKNDPWWPDVAGVTFEDFPSIHHALMTERLAIQAERPPRNRRWTASMT